VLADTRAGADSDAQRAVRDEAIARVAREGSARYVEELVPKLLSARSDKARPLALAIAGLQSPFGVAGALAALRDRPDRSALLPAIAVPTEVVVGAEDALTPPSEAAAMARAIPGATLTEIPGAGHLTPLEAPAAFARAARAVIARVPRR
jgi:pimeloyl-ACP methyl ester carboxylesterase